MSDINTSDNIECLVFRLYGVMASWGNASAVGEERHSDSYPSKSAILGLLGAACGVKRDDPKWNEIANSYSIITSSYVGRFIKDYHTIETVGGNNKFESRFEELKVGRENRKSNTTLSYREYRCDSISFVAIKTLRENPPYELSELLTALKRPKYVLYLGRKSCPLSQPLDPKIIHVEDIIDTLSECNFLSIEDPLKKISKGKNYEFKKNYGFNEYYEKYRAKWGCNSSMIISWEGDLSGWPGLKDTINAHDSIVRRDQILSRTAWTYTNRVEHRYFQDK